MTHFQTEKDVINWLIDNCPRPAIERALTDGRVEYLGGFNPIPPSTLPGWIVKITSVYDKQWIVAILADSIKHRYEIRIIKTVPWKNWMGTDPFFGHKKFMSKLFSGDNPERYKELRDGQN